MLIKNIEYQNSKTEEKLYFSYYWKKNYFPSMKAVLLKKIRSQIYKDS